MRKAGVIITIAIVFMATCKEPAVSGAQLERGKKVYETYCVSCHMDNGSGASNMNAPLIGSAYVTGDTKKLTDILLHGSAALAGDAERKYKNVMPSMAQLNDEEIADVLTYIRNNFGNKAPVVTPDVVKAVREKKN